MGANNHNHQFDPVTQVCVCCGRTKFALYFDASVGQDVSCNDYGQARSLDGKAEPEESEGDAMLRFFRGEK